MKRPRWCLEHLYGYLFINDLISTPHSATRLAVVATINTTRSHAGAPVRDRLRLVDAYSNTSEGGRWVKILHTHRSPPCAMPPLLRESLSLPADTDREATRALHAPCHLPSASELLRE